MISPQYVQQMAAYNHWMNEKLYTLCAELSDSELKADRKAFFRSVHGTLNHLLLGDRIWLGRFENSPFIAKSLDQVLYEDFSELQAERNNTDQRLINWADNLLSNTLQGDLHYEGLMRPGKVNCKLWVAVTHLFNHQTHHRGQLTTLLSQQGIDPGITDLMLMPGLMQTA